MENETNIRRGSIVYSDASFWSLQKYRRKIFDQDAIENCEATLPVFVLILMLNWFEMDGKQDHVHLLINYPPKLGDI